MVPFYPRSSTQAGLSIKAVGESVRANMERAPVNETNRLLFARHCEVHSHLPFLVCFFYTN